jgi:hypothetical protein
MNNLEQTPSLKESVLEKIKANAAPMRSGSYFAGQIFILGIVAVFVLVFSVAICNFILFNLGLNGPGSFFALGIHGFFEFLEVFPWGLLILDVLCIALLEWLLRKFRFGYKSPMLYLLFGILVIVIALSLLIDCATPFNDDLLHSADQHQLPPPFRNFIEGERQQPPPDSGIYKGTITSIGADTLTMNVFGTTTPLTVMVQPQDPIFHSLQVGEVILVFSNGPRNPNSTATVLAQDIHPLPPNAMASDHDDMDDNDGR